MSWVKDYHHYKLNGWRREQFECLGNKYTGYYNDYVSTLILSFFLSKRFMKFLFNFFSIIILILQYSYGGENIIYR